MKNKKTVASNFLTGLEASNYSTIEIILIMVELIREVKRRYKLEGNIFKNILNN